MNRKLSSLSSFYLFHGGTASRSGSC